MFGAPHKVVAKEIAMEQVLRTFEKYPELKKYERELLKLYTVEPMLKRDVLVKAMGEILSAPEAEVERVKRKYMLTDTEIRELRELRKDDVKSAAEDAAKYAERHKTMKTLAAKMEMTHGEGRLSPVFKKIYVSASEESALHEIAHALVAAYLAKEHRIHARAARTISAIMPPENDEAFAFAVSHHYMGIEPDESFFRWVNRAYRKEHGKWDGQRFREKYEQYRAALKDEGLDKTLRMHVRY